jgi:hypothetical protein
MCAGCDVPLCGGRCGTTPYTAPRLRLEALAVAQRRALRLRLGRGLARWWMGGWRPVMMRAWWPTYTVDMPF